MDLAGAVEAAWRASGKRQLAVSRASWLRDAPWFDTAIQVPVVGGRTVWTVIAEPAEVFAVLEQPNYFGRIENTASYGAGLTIQWWNTGEDLGEPLLTADRGIGDLDTAKHLATTLRSVPGVKLPHGVPQAPWLILSLRRNPLLIARALANAGWPGATPLDTTFPEFPGGLHLEVAWPRQDNREVAAVVRAALEDVEIP